MLDPDTDGEEYIEIYNKGNYPVNTKDVFIGLINSQNSYSYIQPLTAYDRAIYPGTYRVICRNEKKLKNKHHTDEFSVLTHRNLPALNNSSAHWQLVYKDGSVIDKIVYDSKWHFRLHNNTKGIALERISINEKTTSPQN